MHSSTSMPQNLGGGGASPVGVFDNIMYHHDCIDIFEYYNAIIAQQYSLPVVEYYNVKSIINKFVEIYKEIADA